MQREGWARIASGAHALLVAPTGSGKTLAAFLASLDRLLHAPAPAEGVRVVYVSPLKALVADIERNLQAPLAGIRRAAAARGETLRPLRVALRTGDTPAAERRRQARDPAEILVTTPESLYLILGSRQRETLRSVDTLIVDEIHALAPDKRGAHLALSLERLGAGVVGRAPQRIGLSATARPAEEVARFLGGDRRVAIVDASAPPRLDLEIRLADPGPEREPEAGGATRPPEATGHWDALLPELLGEIRAHRSVLVFVNSRALCERLAHGLNALAGEPLVRAHHGSLAQSERREIEQALASGVLRALVATSSLELGIDMQAVDLVLLVESPGAVSRGLQRVGRAGHQVGAASRGRFYPKHRGDLLEATVVADGMRRGAVEALRIPHNPLDVLAQQIVAICAAGPIALDALERLVRRTASFRDLPRELLCGVLDMLAGRYPSTDFAELRPRIVWDRARDVLEARPGARQLALVSGGTIPDRGLYAVHLGEDGPRIGELDEEMVHETRAGEVLTLGASSWRVEAITRDRVVVAPAPGEVGKLPFWRGAGPGRPVELGRALGAFVRELEERCGAGDADGRASAEAWLRDRHALDPRAAALLAGYVLEQREATGCLPTDCALTLERFRDELGDWRLCLLSPFGARLHAPWALAIEASLGDRAEEVQTLWSDDGIVLRVADADALPDLSRWLPDPDGLEEQVVSVLERSALFAGQFRENAARALLLPRRRPGARTPLWTQRLRAQNLLAVARAFPSFPIVLETYRSCLQDVFDLPALTALLRAVQQGRVRIDVVETRSASPFARSLVFAWTAAYLYQGDAPVAERRAHALTLDREMLHELLGGEALRALLDPEVLEALVAERQALVPGRRARDAEGVHDLLRRQGDLSEAELAVRCEGDVGAWLAGLAQAGRAVRVVVAGETRWIAAEDAGLARDALGVAPPTGVPQAYLAPAADPRAQWVRRFARHHAPFTAADLARRHAWPEADAAALLERMAGSGQLTAGEIDPRRPGRAWCDPELLRRLRRATLRKLRAEVAPVDAAAWARFLAGWHGIDAPARGERALRAALERLEGAPLSFAELERRILPARVVDFDPDRLDALGARGEWVWIGRGAIAERDLRVMLLRRDRVALLADPPEETYGGTPLAGLLLAHLTTRGACFFPELLRASGAASEAALRDALWELSCAGLVTNDTFAALRGLMLRRERERARRGRVRRTLDVDVGRWSAVSALFAEPESPTRRVHARAAALLDRYGVVSRGVLAHEGQGGGFSGPYRVYREMEERGQLRRGHFVEGLPGAQFAGPGTIDRLRAARDPQRGRAVALAATDPACPFGGLLPWPAPTSPDAVPRRAIGATVVCWDGRPWLYLERSGRRIWSFAGHESGSAEAPIQVARALRQLFAWRRRRNLRIDEIDGVPAARSAWAEPLRAIGFRAGYKGLVLERSDALAGEAGEPIDTG